MRTKHVALQVPDLEHAEAYYRHVFDLDVVFPGHPRPGTVLLIAVVATAQEIASVVGRLPDDTAIEVDQDDALTFLDPFGFRWQLCGPGFTGPGDRHGHWLEVP